MLFVEKSGTWFPNLDAPAPHADPVAPKLGGRWLSYAVMALFTPETWEAAVAPLFDPDPHPSKSIWLTRIRVAASLKRMVSATWGRHTLMQ